MDFAEYTQIITEGGKDYFYVLTKEGSHMWYIPGTSNWHRELGPAVIFSDGTEWWFYNNKKHRDDGPAVKWSSGLVEYWLNGKLLAAKTHEEFLREKKVIILG